MGDNTLSAGLISASFEIIGEGMALVTQEKAFTATSVLSRRQQIIKVCEHQASVFVCVFGGEIAETTS